MTVAVVTLAIALAAAIGALVYLLRDRVRGLASERASMATEIIEGKARVAAELAQRAAEKERDEALAAWAKAANERDAAVAELEDTQRALNQLREEKAHEAVEAIRAAPTAVDALAAYQRLVQAATRREAPPDPAVPAGDDHGGA